MEDGISVTLRKLHDKTTQSPMQSWVVVLCSLSQALLMSQKWSNNGWLLAGKTIWRKKIKRMSFLLK